MTDLHELGVADLLAAFRAGDAGPVDALDACLARIDDLEPALGAVVTPAAERARAEAEASARRWKQGEAGPLDGVPFGVKDNVATAGVRTTAGWARLADWVPEADATAVARLRAAGAVMVAKLATPELAFGDARDGHRPVNPWAPDHWTGGSSSGPAVALASRLVPLAVGTDTGGSIRVPSSYCGITGLKPTAGLVPTDGVVPVSWTLDHVGPMARSAVDAAAALAVMADRPGDADLDPTPERLDGLRVGVPGGWYADVADHAVLAARDAAVAALADAGARPSEVAVPEPEAGGMAAYTITLAEFAATYPDWRDDPGDYTDTSVDRLRAGAAVSAVDYLGAMRRRDDLRARVARLFDDVDVLVTAGSPDPAPRIAPPVDPVFGRGDDMWMGSVARHLIYWNLVGLPAVVVPSGTAADGRPLSVQIVGPPHAERRVLAVAAALQAATPHHLAAPPATHIS